MAIKVGTFTQKTSAGTQVISGLGFIPEAVLFFSSGALASGAYEDHFNAMFGITTGTAAAANGSVTCSSEDAKTTGIHNVTGRAAQKAITICEFGEATKAEADLDSFDADGFTLDWTTADAVARVINYIAISGFTNVKLVEWKMAAGAGNQSITGVGFVPDAVINIHEWNAADDVTPYINATGGIGIGAFTDADEWCMGTVDKDASDTFNSTATSNVDLFASPSTTETFKAAAFVSMDADGFTIDPAATGTPPCMMYSLCMKGGPQVKVGSMIKLNNIPGALAESTGFRPGGLILTSADPLSVKSVSADSVISVGVVDRDSQHAMEFFSDELATSNTAMLNITNRGILRNTNHDSTIETQGFAGHFTEDGFRIDFGNNLTPKMDLNYIAFEETIRQGEPLLVATGVFDKKTSNGVQNISGVGFKPKVLMCWMSGATADDTWQDFLRAGFGAATSTSNRFAAGMAAEEDLTTSNTQTTRSAVDIISIVAPDGTIEGEADLTAFSVDGFRLNWTNSNGTAYKIHYLALAGDEVEEATIVSFVTSTSNGQQSVTGVGFRPDTIICFGNTRISATEDTQHAQGGLLLAVTDGLNHVGIQNFLLDASSTEQHARTTDIDGFIEGTLNTPGEDLHSVFISMDDDGFTFDQINAAPSPGYRVFALCIKGVLTKVGSFNSEVSTTGEKAYTGVGIQPIGLLQFGTTQSVDDAVATRGIFSIGAADGTNENATMMGAERGVGDLACISKINSLVTIDTTDPMATLATTEEGTLTSFDVDGFTIDWTTSDANAVRNMFMAFEKTMLLAGGEDKAATAINTMSLAQTAASVSDLLRTLTSVIAFGQAVRQSIFAKSASSVLSFGQLALADISFNNTFTPSVQSMMVLTQAALDNKGISVSAASLLSLDHQAINESIKSHSVANAMALAQVAVDNFVLASASNILGLTDSAGAGKNVPESVSNIMALVQTVAENFVFGSASNALSLVSTAVPSLNQANVILVSSPIVLADTVSFLQDHGRSIPFDDLDEQAKLQLIQSVVVARNLRVAASNSLGLTSTVTLKEHVEALQSFMSLSQQAGRSLPTSAASTLELIQEAARIHKLSNALNFISSVATLRGRDATNVLTLVQTATVLSDFARSISQPLGIRQSVGLIHEFAAPNIECVYSPFIGEVTSGITPPPANAPALGSATLTLTWPFVSPTTTLVLRNPQLNNSERFQFARINRTTRGGDLTVFADPTWPKQETLKVQIESLTSAQKDSLQSFFEDNIGLEIGLLDDENKQWKGIITQPDADFTDVSGDGCTYAVIFEFEGELQ